MITLAALSLMCISTGWILIITVSSCEVLNKKDGLLYCTYFKMKRNYMLCGLDLNGRIEHFAFLISLQLRLFVFFMARFWFDLIFFGPPYKTYSPKYRCRERFGQLNVFTISAEIFSPRFFPSNQSRQMGTLSECDSDGGFLPDKSQWFFTPLAKSCPRGIVRKSQGPLFCMRIQVNRRGTNLFRIKVFWMFFIVFQTSD